MREDLQDRAGEPSQGWSNSPCLAAGLAVDERYGELNLHGDALVDACKTVASTACQW